MTTLLMALVIFLEIIQWLVIADVILSWLMLLGLRFRPVFLANILDPIYYNIKKYIPTSFGAFDFTPIIIILILSFSVGIIRMNFPEIFIQISQLAS